MVTPEEINQLAEKAKTQSASFNELYDHFLPRIYGFIYKRVGNRAEAEDLASQTFLKMVEHLPNFDPGRAGASFKSWLYRIATNTVIDHYRTDHPTESLDHHTNLETADENPVIRAEKEEKSHSIAKIISLMPLHYQQILHLKFFADLSNAEIAASLEITENNCGVALHRALKSFQKLYNKNLPYVSLAQKFI